MEFIFIVTLLFFITWVLWTSDNNYIGKNQKQPIYQDTSRSFHIRMLHDYMKSFPDSDPLMVGDFIASDLMSSARQAWLGKSIALPCGCYEKAGMNKVVNYRTRLCSKHPKANSRIVGFKPTDEIPPSVLDLYKVKEQTNDTQTNG